MFFNFFFWVLWDLVFRAIFSKFGQNTGFVKYPKEKVEKLKMLKMLLFIICEAPQKISTIFKPILAIFILFHLKKWPYFQKPELGNLAKTRFWLLLVNNSLCSIPLSYARSYIKETPGDRCGMPLLYFTDMAPNNSSILDSVSYLFNIMHSWSKLHQEMEVYKIVMSLRSEKTKRFLL